ncbi:MAG: hypothetical protein HYU28_08445 [Actinobacteria bacterium]|nr:hypothetical protein [Actinomycetota bacterium]
MRKLIAAGVVAAVAGGMALPAFAASGRGSMPPVMTGGAEPKCTTTNERHGDPNGPSHGESGQTVCVSRYGVSVSSWSTGSTSVSSGSTSGAGLPDGPPAVPDASQIPDAQVPGVPIDELEDRVDELLDVIDPAQGEDDPGAEEKDPVKRLLDLLGIKTYEDTVCDDRHDGYQADEGDYATDYLVDEYGRDYVADCWVDDYLLGDYVSNYLLDYVDHAVPGGIGPVKGVAKNLIDEVRSNVTNGAFHDAMYGDVGGAAPPAASPAPPAVPGVGRPSIPSGLPAGLPQGLPPELSGMLDGLL